MYNKILNLTFAFTNKILTTKIKTGLSNVRENLNLVK